jgi:hypothetical protein
MKKISTIEQAYNEAILELYLKTGQGMPCEFLDKAVDSGLAKELKGENDLVEVAYDGVAKVYIPKGAYLASLKDLSYQRVYLGIPNGVPMLNMTNEELLEDPDYKEGYERWIAQYGSKVDESMALMPVSVVLNTDGRKPSLQYLKSLGCYKSKKDTIAKGKNSLFDRLSGLKDLYISLSETKQSMVSIYKDQGMEEDLKEAQAELQENKNKIDCYEYALKEIKNYDPSISTFEFVNLLEKACS